MYPEIKDTNTLNKRFDLMRVLAGQNTLRLKEFIMSPMKNRISGTKRDRTIVTLLDYEINLTSMKLWLQNFPEDSFDGEESHIIRPDADYTVYEDPVDSTDHARHYNQHDPHKKNWPTYMLSLAYRGAPVAFALGVPVRDELYIGSVSHGVFLNGNVYVLPERHMELIIGYNEEKHAEFLLEHTGHKNVGIAGFCAWLILGGYAIAGKSPFHLPHESTCLAGAVRSLGGTISNAFGGPFAPYDEIGSLVWSLPPLDHRSTVELPFGSPVR